MVVVMTATATTYFKALGAMGTLTAPSGRGLTVNIRRSPAGDLGPGGVRGCSGHGARVRDGLGDLGVSTDPCAPQTVVGDSEYHHFRYRIPPERVRVVEVGGDLQLESVKIF